MGGRATGWAPLATINRRLACARKYFLRISPGGGLDIFGRKLARLLTAA